MANEADFAFGMEIAAKVNVSTDQELRNLLNDLLRKRRLSQAVVEMNGLLREPEHTYSTGRALRRMGLGYGG